MKDRSLLVLNGPGLADPGTGDDRYSGVTLEQVRDECSALCGKLGMRLEFRQTDDQDEMCRWIAADGARFDALLVNPVGDVKTGTVDFDLYRSAIEKIALLNKPVVEVHPTNIFRHGETPANPLQGPAGSVGFVCGFGLHSYVLGIRAVAERLQG